MEVLLAVFSFLGGGVGMKLLDMWQKNRDSTNQNKVLERKDFVEFLSTRVEGLEKKALDQEKRIEQIQLDNIECDRRWRDCEARHLVSEKEMEFLKRQINGISKNG